MKLTLVQAAEILVTSAPLLRGLIRHPRVRMFVGQKPATVELAAILKCKTTMVNPSSNAGRPR